MGTAGHQRGARYGTDRCANVQVRKFHALRAHAVEIRRLESLGTETADVGVTQIATEKESKIWFWDRRGGEAAVIE